jgi:hypothetical protein
MANESNESKAKVPNHVVFYYDKRDGTYWRNITGEFVKLGGRELTLHMRSLGLTDELIKTDAGWTKQIEWPIWNAFTNNRVSFAGPLAGHRVGIFKDSSEKRYLVTEEARGVWDAVPKKAIVPPFFFEFIQELLPDPQWPHFCHWLAIALRSLRRGDFRPGQVAVLAGPAQCGKSFAQYCITEVLGGRCGDPTAYLTGEKFNSDIVGAEHWQVEDPKSTTDLRSRREFGEKLKECANNESFNSHGKGKDAVKVPSLFRRISITINDETENLARIPPMDDSIKDKVSLYKCETVVKSFDPFTVTTPSLEDDDIVGDQDRAAIKRKIAQEVPLIRAWLLRTFREVPAEWQDRRAGIKSYHHPVLMAALDSLSPELKMLQIIDDVLFDKNNPTPWTGKAIDLEKELRSPANGFAFEVEKLLRYSGACPTYLGRLSKAVPKRVSKRIRDGYASWTITTPPSIGEHNEQSDNDGTPDARP